MDSRSRRLPFCLPSSRSSYTSSPRVSSSSLDSSRLHSRDVLLNNDRYPRTSSTYKADLDQQSSRLLGSARPQDSTRYFSSSDSRSADWKLPSSVTSSSRSFDRPWVESSLSSRSKLTDSEGRLGMRSVLLNTTDDGDSKRAKLSYSNRGLYSRTPSTSVTGSPHSSNGLSSGRGEKQSDTSSWSSCHLLSQPSSSSLKPLMSRREFETKNEPTLSGLGEGRFRTGLASSLYQTDRATSTYAQGARPKETTYCPSSSSYSSTARQSSIDRHTSSPSSSSSSSFHRSSLARDFSSSTTTRFLSRSSALHSSQEPTGKHQSSSDASSSYPSRTSWYTSPLSRAEVPLPPRPAPEGGEPEGHRSTRRLLSRLFSRRSSQDSSSGSSSVRSRDDDGPTTGGESVVREEVAQIRSGEPDMPGSEAAFGVPRNHRAELSPIQENNGGGYRRGLAQSRMSACREPGVGSNSNASNGGSSSSWLSSSLRGRCSPLLSRLRRHIRNESAGLQEGHTHPQHLPRRWDNLEHNTSQDDDDDDDEDEEEDEEEIAGGASGVDAFGESRPCKLEDETLPELEDASVEFSPRRRVGMSENLSVPVGPVSGAESRMDDEKKKPVSSRDLEKLRKIKERLLLEDSDEEEGDLCRICQMGEEAASNPLIQPCRCTGSLQYVHQECIKRWLCSKINSGTNLEAITTCELCKEKLRLNIDNFDIQELYRTHVQSEYDEFISSGLYLVVLLHFCEQRFSDVLGAVDAAGLFNLVRILHEHMDNLEIPPSETEEGIQDNRPSIEFSDLDDDLEEDY